MPIDASIPLSVKPVSVENPLNALARVLQVQGLQRENELGGMKMDEYRRGIEQTNKLNQLYSQALNPDGTVNREALLRGAAQQGLGSQIPGLQKQFGEADKAGAELNKTRAETMVKKAGLYRDALAGVTSPQQAAQWLASQYQDPDIKGIFPMPFEQAAAGIPQDAAGFQQWIQKQALGMGKFIEQNAPKVTQVNTGGAVELVSTPGLGGAPSTLQSYKRTASPESQAMLAQAQATRDAAKITANQNTEMKLADDYRTQSKPFKEVSDAYRQISNTLDKATTSPAATLAAATKFMKLLDPGSVVRESELGMALAASGVIDRAFNYYNVLQRGKVLTPTQAADFKRITGEIYKAAQQSQQAIDADYTSKATTYGLRPEMVIQDLGQRASMPASGGGAPGVINFSDLK